MKWEVSRSIFDCSKLLLVDLVFWTVTLNWWDVYQNDWLITELFFLSRFVGGGEENERIFERGPQCGSVGGRRRGGTTGRRVQRRPREGEAENSWNEVAARRHGVWSLHEDARQFRTEQVLCLIDCYVIDSVGFDWLSSRGGSSNSIRILSRMRIRPVNY